MKLPLPDDDTEAIATCGRVQTVSSCSSATYQDSIEDIILSSSMSSLKSLATRSITWDTIQSATTSDEDMHTLHELITSGLRESKNEYQASICEYHQFCNDLYTVDGVIIYKDRILVPPALQPEVLSSLHAAHQGVSSMIARAEASVLWPGITPAITMYRAQCNHCNRIAPSNQNSPPIPPTIPDYPFQNVCADFFLYKGTNYLVIVDRYSNWPIVEKSVDFVTFGIPDELSSDGGPEFTSNTTHQFLTDLGVHHRISSVAIPHSNCRAEIGAKTMKRSLMDDTRPNGDLNTYKFQHTILQYRNTPDRDTKLSPAMCVFGRPIRDFIPILPGKYKPHNTWRETLAAREEALRNRHMRAAEHWTEHIQNQTGPHPLKWDKTGTVIEVQQFDQYTVRVDGSGWVTLRNRKFLRKYLPVHMPTLKGTLLKLKEISPSHRDQPVSPTSTTVHVPPCQAPSDDMEITSKPEQTPTGDLPQLPTRDDTPDVSASSTLKPDQQRTPQQADCNLPSGSIRNDHVTTPRRSTCKTRQPAWHSDYEMTL